MIYIIIVGAWLLCSFVTLGAYVGYFDHPHSGDYRGTLSEGMLFSLMFGPVGVIVSLFSSGFYARGWRVLPLRGEE